MPRRSSYLLLAFLALLGGLPPCAFSQTPPPAKKPAVGPPAPQSTHYPILLLAFGNDPTWSLRVGQKGPERLDRPGYPPIPLEPSEVTHEVADSWTYHAKDSATGATVAVHLTRDACTDATNDTLTTTPPPTGKYAFRASVEHAQIGSLKGCARIAAELFPKISNQADDEEEDSDKKKPPVPTITNFKPPVAIAYINSAGKVIFKRGAITHIVPTEGHQLSVSHDGMRLLYTREDIAGDRTILLFDFATQKSTELLRGAVQQAFWSPDDSHFAFMKLVEGKWHLWAAPIASPENAASLYSGEIMSIHGWVDAHTILVDDLLQLVWVSDDGPTKQTLTDKEVYGDAFGVTSASTVRIHPLNPDLLLVSAEMPKPATGSTTVPKMGTSLGFFLYEIHSKRRVLLSPPNLLSRGAEWSRDGLQVFFTGTDSSRRTAIYRVFWDGSALQRYATGSGLAVGQ